MCGGRSGQVLPRRVKEDAAGRRAPCPTSRRTADGPSTRPGMKLIFEDEEDRGDGGSRGGTASRAPAVRAVAAGSVGNLVEWYEFGVYGYLATVLADRFFTPEGGSAAEG